MPQDFDHDAFNAKYREQVDETAQLYALLGYYHQMSEFQRMLILRFAKGLARPSNLRIQSIETAKANIDFEAEDRWRNPNMIILEDD